MSSRAHQLYQKIRQIGNLQSQHHQEVKMRQIVTRKAYCTINPWSAAHGGTNTSLDMCVALRRARLIGTLEIHYVRKRNTVVGWLSGFPGCPFMAILSWPLQFRCFNLCSGNCHTANCSRSRRRAEKVDKRM